MLALGNEQDMISCAAYEEYVSDRVVLSNRIFRFLDVAEMEELPNNPYSKGNIRRCMEPRHQC